MQISKLLEIATAKHEDFYQIYEAVNDKNTWKKITLDDSSEKDKLKKAVELVDEQTKSLMVPPIRSLISETRSKFKLHHGNEKNCNYEEAYSSLWFYVTSNKKTKSTVLFNVYYEYLTKDGPWGLGMLISIAELDNMKTLSSRRRNLERGLQKIVGKDWATTEEMLKYWKQIGISEETAKEEIEDGGCIRFKQPLELKAGDDMSIIHERIIEVGRSSFIRNISEFKKFWRNALRDIDS